MTVVRKPGKDPVFNDTLDALLQDYLVLGKEDPQKERFRNKIIEHTMPYVRKIAHGLARRSSDPIDDLIQVGSIGLLKAVEKFNPLAGSSFKTYATYFITGEIRHYIRDKATVIKAPRQMYELYYRVNQIVQLLSERLNRPPTDLEIASELQCPVVQVSQVQDIERRRSPVSLDQFLIGDGENAEGVYLERLVDEKDLESLQRQENRLLVEHALSELKPELQSVVRMTYYDDMSQTAIAEQLGISQMQVSRRLRKALDVLMHSLDGEAGGGKGKVRSMVGSTHKGKIRSSH
jgi:RNA polymerase sigma-B factor